MNFQFQQMKPVIQRDFDEILCHYPTDVSRIDAVIAAADGVWGRKMAVIETAARECDVHLFAHYPFAFELDFGERRDCCYFGVGNHCAAYNGLDQTELAALRSEVSSRGLGSVGNYWDFLHNTTDHDKLLSVGFRGVYEECERLNETETDPEKKQYRTYVMRICRAVELMGLRLREREKEQQMADIKGEMKKIEWGSQIRSYVFQPYTMVKDHRTGFEVGAIDDVMNGHIEGFVTSYLKMQ